MSPTSHNSAGGAGPGGHAGSTSLLLQDVTEADVVCVSTRALVSQLAEMFGGCPSEFGAGARTWYDLDAIEYQAR
jgi:hypothetical protein